MHFHVYLLHRGTLFAIFKKKKNLWTIQEGIAGKFENINKICVFFVAPLEKVTKV
jgi:hypothetical protein